MEGNTFSNNATPRSRGRERFLQCAAFFVLIFGSLFVSKELWHAHLCRRLSDLQSQRASLENTACRLGYAVAPLEDVNVLVSRAQNELNMVFRKDEADTVWVKDLTALESDNLRAGFLDFKLPRELR